MKSINKIDQEANTKNIGYSKDLFVKLSGKIVNIRKLSKIVFIDLQDYQGTIQCVVTEKSLLEKAKQLKNDFWINVSGKVAQKNNNYNQYEILAHQIDILNDVSKNFSIHKPEHHSPLRSISLRDSRRQKIFSIKSSLQFAFGDFLVNRGFIRINTPKIIFEGLEGGSKLFPLNYFGSTAFLSQSPQLYKQMLTGSLQRVFEIGPVFRANHNKSSSQLTEYTSLDVEFGPISEMIDTQEMYVSLISYALDQVNKKHLKDFNFLEATPYAIENIPSITHHRALEITGKNKIENKDEATIGKYFKKEFNSDFVFITNWPIKDTTFYFMDDESISGSSKNWILLFKGLSIGGGGQRIHSHQAQVNRLIELNMDVSDFTSYLTAHEYGLPPHGGFTISIERFMMVLLGIKNIKDCSLFPISAP